MNEEERLKRSKIIERHCETFTNVELKDNLIILCKHLFKMISMFVEKYCIGQIKYMKKLNITARHVYLMHNTPKFFSFCTPFGSFVLPDAHYKYFMPFLKEHFYIKGK